MSVARLPPRTSVIDVLDHVLDKGIVIDAWIRVALAGIDLLTVEARVVVASIGTYVAHARAIGDLESVASPQNASTHPRRPTLEEQLQEVRELLESGRAMMGHEHRRAQDRFVEELRDAHGRTLARTKRSGQAGHRRRSR